MTDPPSSQPAPGYVADLVLPLHIDMDDTSSSLVLDNGSPSDVRFVAADAFLDIANDHPTSCQSNPCVDASCPCRAHSSSSHLPLSTDLEHDLGALTVQVDTSPTASASGFSVGVEDPHQVVDVAASSLHEGKSYAVGNQIEADSSVEESLSEHSALKVSSNTLAVNAGLSSDPLSSFDDYNLATYMQGAADFGDALIDRYSNLFQLQTGVEEDVGITTLQTAGSNHDTSLDMQAFCEDVMSKSISTPPPVVTEGQPVVDDTPMLKKKKKKRLSKRELARAASAAEAAREQEIARLAKMRQITDEELLRLKPKKQRRAARFEKPVPSRFCHVCSRTPKNVRLVVCSKIKMGVCRKVICEKCFEEYGWGNFEQALDTMKSSWICPHCLEECPVRAQCRTYQRINDRLRVNRLKQEKPIKKRGKRKRDGKMKARLAVTEHVKAEEMKGKDGDREGSEEVDEDMADAFVDGLLLDPPSGDEKA